jgi:hypothetical protein
MAREGELPLRREDANAIISTGHPWLQEKGRLAKVRPIGEGSHLSVVQCIRANNDRQRVAEHRSRREHVDLLKRKIGHEIAPG